MDLLDFVRESNRIEGINREPTDDEMMAHGAILNLQILQVSDLEGFVSVIAPGHKLRCQYGLDVRVGDHIAPRGCPEIRTSLEAIMNKAARGDNPWQVHVEYETLHLCGSPAD